MKRLIRADVQFDLDAPETMERETFEMTGEFECEFYFILETLMTEEEIDGRSADEMYDVLREYYNKSIIDTPETKRYFMEYFKKGKLYIPIQYNIYTTLESRYDELSDQGKEIFDFITESGEIRADVLDIMSPKDYGWQTFMEEACFGRYEDNNEILFNPKIFYGDVKKLVVRTSEDRIEFGGNPIAMGDYTNENILINNELNIGQLYKSIK